MIWRASSGKTDGNFAREGIVFDRNHVLHDARARLLLLQGSLNPFPARSIRKRGEENRHEGGEGEGFLICPGREGAGSNRNGRKRSNRRVSRYAICSFPPLFHSSASASHFVFSIRRVHSLFHVFAICPRFFFPSFRFVFCRTFSSKSLRKFIFEHPRKES